MIFQQQCRYSHSFFDLFSSKKCAGNTVLQYFDVFSNETVNTEKTRKRFCGLNTVQVLP